MCKLEICYTSVECLNRFTVPIGDVSIATGNSRGTKSRDISALKIVLPTSYSNAVENFSFSATVGVIHMMLFITLLSCFRYSLGLKTHSNLVHPCVYHASDISQFLVSSWMIFNVLEI